MRKLHKLYWPFKFFFTIYLPKLFDYAKILWNDYDFEFEGVLDIIALKTKRTRECLIAEGMIRVDERKMKEVELLCQRLKEDDYLAEDAEELNSRFPPSVRDMWFGSNGVAKEKEDLYFKEYHIIFKRQERIHKQDKERLFYLLHKYLNCWWS